VPVRRRSSIVDHEANAVRVESTGSALGNTRSVDSQRRDRSPVRLIRKSAERIDGVDLRAHAVGDVFDLPATDARLLIAEKSAIPARCERIPRAHSAHRDDVPD
jgi:hypothetical protein